MFRFDDERRWEGGPERSRHYPDEHLVGHLKMRGCFAGGGNEYCEQFRKHKIAELGMANKDADWPQIIFIHNQKIKASAIKRLRLKPTASDDEINQALWDEWDNKHRGTELEGR